MPIFDIPLLNIPRQRLNTAVNGQEVAIAVWWQPKDQRWYMTLEFPVGTPLIRGKRINLNSPILGSLKGEFVGDFVCRIIGEILIEPGAEPWGNTHALRYESE